MAYTDFDSAQNAREEAARSKRRNVRVYLIRHAESEANLRKGEIGGRQNDVNLSEKGILQAKLLAPPAQQISFEVLGHQRCGGPCL